MSSIKLYKPTGEAGGDVAFDDALLVVDRGAQAVKDVVVATMNARRAGTASSLSKGEVAGSNKKPWKQKGTGRARAGLRQSPVWRGGAVAFGPRPRSYETKINRKVYQLAFRHAFSARIQAGGVSVIERFELADAKTHLIGSYPLRFDSTLKAADALLGIQLAGLPIDYIEKRATYLDGVTLADAKRVARRLYLADNLRFLVLGQPTGVTGTLPPPAAE